MWRLPVNYICTAVEGTFTSVSRSSRGFPLTNRPMGAFLELCVLLNNFNLSGVRYLLDKWKQKYESVCLVAENGVVYM